GERLLENWLRFPLRDQEKILLRQSAIRELFLEKQQSSFEPFLKIVGDLERIIGRIALRSARPKDLVRLRSALSIIPSIKRLLQGYKSLLLEKINFDLKELDDLKELLSSAIVESPPVHLRDGR